MLTENTLPFVLPSAMLCNDGNIWLTHNTKQCYSLSAMLLQNPINGTLLRRILVQIVTCSREMEAYLLSPDDLVIKESYLYFEKELQEIRMICVPGHHQPVKTALRELLEFLMPRFDHSDREGERFLYECYRILSDEWQDISAFSAYIESESLVESPVERTGYGQESNHENERKNEDGNEISGHQLEEPEKDTIFSKRFFLFTLAGGAALALIIKYLFFDGTTGTAIFGVAWLLTLIVLAIMTVREKEDTDDDIAMQEYSNRHVKQGNAREGEQNDVALPSVRYEKIATTTSGYARLIPLTNGALEPLCISPGKDTLTIGRDKTADYRVAASQISRCHAKLRNKPDGLYIEDQNSTNGTFLNTKRLPSMTEYKLSKGDIIGIANEEFFIG